MKSYRAHIADARTDWWENISADAPEGVQRAIDNFNSSLRPGESARRVLAVEAGDGPIPHKWEKSNLVTVMKGGAHDTYRCAACGITGKRYGLSETVLRDKKFAAAKYEGCKSQ
jgi:hypothetical protein